MEKIKNIITPLFVIFQIFSALSPAASIPDQPGNSIICPGPFFTYQHDVRQHGIDANLNISGDAGFIVETGNPYASFYTDAAKSNGSAVYQYTFAAEAGKILGDVSITSRASVFENGNVPHVKELKVPEN